MDTSSHFEQEPAQLAALEPALRPRAARLSFLFTFPWWVAILVLGGIGIYYLISTDEVFSGIFDQLKEGVGMTLKVSLVAYTSALFIGLVVGLIRSNPPTAPRYQTGMRNLVASAARTILYNVATLYVSVLRGLPILTVLLIVAFVLIPTIKEYLKTNYGIELPIKGTSPESAMIALALLYGAFLSETFRAGIQSISRGQIEAARSLGMNYYQTIRFVVLPQAIRRILPPLGNDMISMVKDSSLVAMLGIRDITQIAKTSSGASFRYLETYLIAAVLYLTMTITGSQLVRFIERRTRLDH